MSVSTFLPRNTSFTWHLKTLTVRITSQRSFSSTDCREFFENNLKKSSFDCNQNVNKLSELMFVWFNMTFMSFK